MVLGLTFLKKKRKEKTKKKSNEEKQKTKRLSPNSPAGSATVATGDEHGQAASADPTLRNQGAPDAQLQGVVALLSAEPLALLGAEAHAGLAQPPAGEGVVAPQSPGDQDGKDEGHVPADPGRRVLPVVGGVLDGGPHEADVEEKPHAQPDHLKGVLRHRERVQQLPGPVGDGGDQGHAVRLVLDRLYRYQRVRRVPRHHAKHQHCRGCHGEPLRHVFWGCVVKTHCRCFSFSFFPFFLVFYFVARSCFSVVTRLNSRRLWAHTPRTPRCDLGAELSTSRSEIFGGHDGLKYPCQTASTHIPAVCR